MPAKIVMGALWGDEGKGKISDFLAENAKAVVRWSGGNNAGHTVVLKDKKYKLHLMPSGVCHKDTYAIVGNGCVLNPKSFIKEIEYVKEQNLYSENIVISKRVHITMPYHILLDGYQEEVKKNKIGTTKKGIGPTYMDKVKRSGIRMAEFINPEILKEKLKVNIKFYNKLFKDVYNKPEINFEEIYLESLKQADVLRPFVKDTTMLINKLSKDGEEIIFEGAQGVLLDIDFGTYPYVTSSNPIGSAATVGSGIRIQDVEKVYGITKAYCSRVGAGGMPTLITCGIGDTIAEVGHEYGTTTGRRRDVGWLDIVALNHSIRVSSMSDIVITLLDVITGIKELKLCVGYNIDDVKDIIEFPALESELARAKAQYITLPGWEEDITGVKSFDELPVEAQNYILKVEELTGLPVSIFSVGPERSQTVFR